MIRNNKSCGLALGVALALCVSEAQAQRAGPPPADAIGGVNPKAPPPDPADTRLGGLYMGARGFTSGPGGGLDLELTRNGNAVPLPPALAKTYAPPSADPRDFQGSWQGEQYIPTFEIMHDMYGAKVPFTVKGRKVMDQRLIAMDTRKPFMSPAFLCRPSGPDWDLIFIPFQIFQSKDRLDVFSDADRLWWPIALDPAILPKESGNTYQGRSVGHWDGDALVVETTAFKNRRWLSFRGTPISPAGKLTYRIRKMHDGDHWYLEIVTTVDDPAYYTRPWKYMRSFEWRPDMALMGEYDCESQIDANDSGAVAEPND